VIADYIAGMTDRFALEEHHKLFDPFEKVEGQLGRLFAIVNVRDGLCGLPSHCADRPTQCPVRLIMWPRAWPQAD
jgi:hypothetical protein